MTYHRENNSKPLLTLAIPTYNRARFLSENLEVLCPQLIDEHRVELLICDNASPDRTPEIVSDFQSKGLKIRYLRNSTNLGADANILRCFEEASGKYVWVFGDDDFIIPGAVAKILDLLENSDYNLVYVSPYTLYGDFHDSQKEAAVLNISYFVADSKQLAREVHAMFAFISSNIANKDRLATLSYTPLTDLIGSNLVHLGWLFPLLDASGKNLLIQSRLVAARYANSGGFSIGRVFGENLRSIAEQRFRTQPKLTQVIIDGTLQRWHPHRALETRTASGGDFAPEDTHQLLEAAFGRNPRYWFFVFPVIKLPLLLAKGWFLLIRAINRFERMFTLSPEQHPAVRR